MKIDKTTPPLPASQIGELAPRSPNAKPAEARHPVAQAFIWFYQRAIAEP